MQTATYGSERKRTGQEAADALKDYQGQAKQVGEHLAHIEASAENSIWEHAVMAHTEVERLANEFGDIRTKEAIYEDVSKTSKLGHHSIKKRSLTVSWLFDSHMEHVAVKPVSAHTNIAEIVNSGLNDDLKQELVTKVYTNDRKHPEAPFTQQAIRAMIKDLKPSTGAPDWERGTDNWSFADFDPRFGHDGYHGRLPGQVALNLVKRWLPPGGHLLSAMCGSGTVMDAAKHLKMTKEIRGFDIHVSERAAERHNDAGDSRITKFDATRAGWEKSVPKGWKSDMTVVTPPDFNFFRQSMTDEETDLGNIIDPMRWLAAWEAIAHGIMSVTAQGGIVAVVTRNTAEFEDGTPVPDMEYEVVRRLHEVGVEMFVARAAVRVARAAPKSDASEGKPWLVPEVRHVNVYRLGA